MVAEIMAADVIVIGAPIYNFSVPAALKAWIDLVARVVGLYTIANPVDPELESAYCSFNP